MSQRLRLALPCLLVLAVGCAGIPARQVTGDPVRSGSPADGSGLPQAPPEISALAPGAPVKPHSPYRNGPAAPAAAETDRGRPTIPEGDSVVEKNIRVNPADGVRGQNETAIAVSKTNPLNIVGVARDEAPGEALTAWYTTVDGGLTWTGGVIDDETNLSESDPVITACPDGSFVLVLLSINPGSALFTYRSTDGGFTWNKTVVYENPEATGPRVDKPWLTCDDTGSFYHGRVYLEWMQWETLGEQQLMIATSYNGGLTWNREVEFADEPAAQNQGVVGVGPAGELYVVWSKRTDDGLHHMFDRSLNGGRTYETDRPIASVSDIPIDGVVRRLAYPAMAVDGKSDRFAGNIYVTWSGNRNGNPDILFVRSTDGGDSWTEPVRVNDDSTYRDQYNPWIAVDSDGNVFITWWDRRRTKNREYEIWGVASYDGGVTFDTNFVISDLPSDGTLDDFFGDYAGLDVSDEFLYSLWVDTREGVFGDTDVYTDRYPNLFDYNEVRNLAWSDPQTLSFDEQDSIFGEAVDHDVLGGLLSELRADAGFDRAVCHAPAWNDSPFAEPRTPPIGEAYYYLVRAHGPRGVGSYGDAAPIARTNLRDPLDETLPICP